MPTIGRTQQEIESKKTHWCCPQKCPGGAGGELCLSGWPAIQGKKRMGFQAEASINKEIRKQQITQLCAENLSIYSIARMYGVETDTKRKAGATEYSTIFYEKPRIPSQWKGFPRAQNLICCNRSTLSYTSVWLCLITFKRCNMILHRTVVKAKKKSKYYNSEQYAPVRSYQTFLVWGKRIKTLARAYLWVYTHTHTTSNDTELPPNQKGTEMYSHFHRVGSFTTPSRPTTLRHGWDTSPWSPSKIRTWILGLTVPGSWVTREPIEST